MAYITIRWTSRANRAQMIPMFTLTEYHFFTVAKGTA